MKTPLTTPRILELGRAVGIALVLAMSLAGDHTLGADPLAGLDEFIENARAEWEAPGFAIAIIKDDAVVYAKGFGVRAMGKPDPVDENSLFAVGSTSKAFTVALIGMLVEEGRLTWEDKVTGQLKGFELFDPYATRELTLRDLVTHRSGLARGDALWYGTELSREEILHKVRYLEPTWSFRARYSYQNIMFLAAGQVVAAVTGKSWDENIRERIFDPLGMDRSLTSVIPLRNDRNVAWPHAKLDGKIEVIRYRNIDNIAPAGSINSSVAMMARWVRMQLGEGTFEGVRLLKPESIKEMHTPFMVLPPGPDGESMGQEMDFLTYGLAWMLHTWRGQKVVRHGGGIDGMATAVGMIPEQELGVVAISNISSLLPQTVMFHVFDRYLGVEDTDWPGSELKRLGEIDKKEELKRKSLEANRPKDTKPSLALGKYAGEYEHALYGQVRVSLRSGALNFHRGAQFTGRMEHWAHNTFRVIYDYRPQGKQFVTFALDEDGAVAYMTDPDLGRFDKIARDAPLEK